MLIPEVATFRELRCVTLSRGSSQDRSIDPTQGAPPGRFFP